jgi:hypothetical protein
MLLEQNGKASSSKRTKHINVRYFFVKDKIAKGEIELEHCPTEVMWADMNTKPKQGRAWIVFRSMLMGIPDNYNDKKEGIARAKAMAKQKKEGEDLERKKTIEQAVAMTPDRLQECVGENQNKENAPPRVNKRHKKNPAIMVVRGRRWSPSIYRNARLAGFEVNRRSSLGRGVRSIELTF